MLFNDMYTFVKRENNFRLLPVLQTAVENKFGRKLIFTELVLTSIMTFVDG
jgi:hypothetical protein